MHPAIVVLITGTLLALVSRLPYFMVRRPTAGAILQLGAVALLLVAIVWAVALAAAM